MRFFSQKSFYQYLGQSTTDDGPVWRLGIRLF